MRFCFDKSSNSFDKERFCFDTKKRVVSCAETTLFYGSSTKNEGVISFPAGYFPGASDEPLYSRCSLQGLICDANLQGVAHQNEDQLIHGICFNKYHP